MYQNKGKPKVKKVCPICRNAMRVQKVTKYMRYWKCQNCNIIYAHEISTDRLVTKIERYDNPVEKHESKFITSKDYEKPDVNLQAKFYEYKDKYVPNCITIEQAELDYAKIIKYCKSKNAKPHEILTVFERYWKNIPVNEMLNWMKVNNKTEIKASKSYYNARKYSKIFK